MSWREAWPDANVHAVSMCTGPRPLRSVTNRLILKLFKHNAFDLQGIVRFVRLGDAASRQIT